MSTMSHDRTIAVERRVNSAVWSAWADALGFISELTDEAGLRRRMGGGHELREPVKWQRRVGGKFGVTTNLPAGTYSDDTQLRLAVGRAIRPSGFDPEVFAKVELPIWTSYALGGGRASKAAAASITNPAVPWFGNFFKDWTAAGGNGAAMRIQPHVWAAPNPGPNGSYLMDVLADAVITHGHPRALVGALFHAMSLGYALDRGTVPLPEHWLVMIDEMHQYPSSLREHPVLSLWCAAWERESGQSFDDVWKATLVEVTEMLPAAEVFASEGATAAAVAGESASFDQIYVRLIQELGLQAPETRGSGTGTVVAALALALAGAEFPLPILRLAVGALGTDTDTIASMAAALLGAVRSESPPGPLMDREYIEAEAGRLAAIALGEQPESKFSYPDLLRWEPPKTQADAVGLIDGVPAVAGLGVCDRMENAGSVKNFTWSWASLDFGQTVLVKHRSTLVELAETQHPGLRQSRPTVPPRGQQLEIEPASAEPTVSEVGAAEIVEPEFSSASSVYRRRIPRRDQDLNVDAMLDWVRARGYSDEAVGYAVRRIAELGTTEQMIAFTSTLKAEIKVRREPHRRSD
ncbi:ADP-ribosylglycohydrolase family protein [Streptomyces canus]|uniref:ADP-ribosylglycohydrolase family protein n=1 Tax=Streptomyces canus TaxID=58343 RepID=UPI002250EA35|nr:ADP-ribosylglycohydrolase family protein [Streptomyces canus]MCX4856652.1 ADP-ribosylglycohydrolase family protein [Streptomyces canus]